MKTKLLIVTLSLMLLLGCTSGNPTPVQNPSTFDNYIPWWVDNVSTQTIINYKF